MSKKVQRDTVKRRDQARGRAENARGRAERQHKLADERLAKLHSESADRQDEAADLAEQLRRLDVLVEGDQLDGHGDEGAQARAEGR